MLRWPWCGLWPLSSWHGCRARWRRRRGCCRWRCWLRIVAGYRRIGDVVHWCPLHSCWCWCCVLVLDAAHWCCCALVLLCTGTGCWHCLALTGAGWCALVLMCTGVGCWCWVLVRVGCCVLALPTSFGCCISLLLRTCATCAGFTVGTRCWCWLRTTAVLIAHRYWH